MLQIASGYCAAWVIAIIYIMVKKSTVFNELPKIDRYSLICGIGAIGFGNILTAFNLLTDHKVDVYFVRLGFAVVLTWVYFFHIKIFKKNKHEKNNGNDNSTIHTND